MTQTINSLSRVTLSHPFPKIDPPKDDKNNGSTVYITVDGVTMTITVVDGKWSWQAQSPMSDGDHVISFFIVDRAGNVSKTKQYLLTIDTTPPDAPEILQASDDFGASTGILRPGEITDDKTPTLKGSAEPNSTVKIYAGDKLVGETTADRNGLWQVEVELDNGTHELRAEAIDKVNRVSDKSAPFTLTINAPAEGIDNPPVLTDVWDDVGPGIGSIGQDGYTNDNLPTFSGTGIAGETVVIFDNDTEIGTVLVDTNGEWRFTPATPLADGEHAITVAHQGSDKTSAAWDFNVDTQRPDIPDPITGGPGEDLDNPPLLQKIWDDIGPGIGNVAANGYTNDNLPTFSGTGVAGQTVELFDGGISIGTAPIAADGTWSFTPASALADGTHGVTAAHQGSSVQSPAWTFTVDTQRPDIPDPVINALLQDASEGMFIDNGKTQLLVGSDDTDMARLHATLNAADSPWEQQAGSVTVGGQQYQVYSQPGQETELLMLETGKSELA